MNLIMTREFPRSLALAGILALACWSCATSQPTQHPVSGASTARVQSTPPSRSTEEGRFMAPQCVVPYYPPPTVMDLCGETVPLQKQEVLERFDKEFTLVVYNRAQIYLWLKRMERYFPWIEERLRANGLPEDLKYVAVAESDLLPDACSPKGAAGPWQFMPSTGSAYGLQQKGTCDERYDFERATECAFRYLNDLYRRYRNWTVAIATYNCGDKRIQDQIRSLGVADYYQMRLPTETERYVFRILAIKAVLGNPGQYGYHLPAGQGYPPFRAERVHLQLSCPLPMHNIAEATGTTVREIKRLNPAYRSEEIPQGAHQIKVPEGSGHKLGKTVEAPSQKSAPPLQEAPASPEEEPSATGETMADETTPEDTSPVRSVEPSRPERQATVEPIGKTRGAPPKQAPANSRKPATHSVKKGETLSAIAGRYGVSVDELKRANKLKSRDVSPGQKLVIP